jgi:plasmid stabilization system protein ParE
MAYELIWSAEAENDFRNIVLYLKVNWSIQSAEKFIQRTYRRLDKLAEMPAVGRSTSQKSVYMYKLDRKNVVFFSIESNHLVICNSHNLI